MCDIIAKGWLILNLSMHTLRVTGFYPLVSEWWTKVNIECTVQVIVVTWARGICLICMPEARGPQARGMRACISGKSRAHMLHHA